MDKQKYIKDGLKDALAYMWSAGDDSVIISDDFSGLGLTEYFSDKFNDRFLCFGQADISLPGICAGLCLAGKVPYVITSAYNITYRLFEQIRSIASVPGITLNLIGVETPAELPGRWENSGFVEDTWIMSRISNMKVLVPCDYHEAIKSVIYAGTAKEHVYIRIETCDFRNITDSSTGFLPGKGAILTEGNTAAVFASGAAVSAALHAAETLKKNGIDISVVNFHTISPGDTDLIRQFIEMDRKIVIAGTSPGRNLLYNTVKKMVPDPQKYLAYAMVKKSGYADCSKKDFSEAKAAGPVIDAVRQILDRSL